MEQRDPAQRHRPLRPVRRQFVVPGQALQQQQAGHVAEVRHDRVEQDAGHVVDVERVADPGERVVQHLPAHERGIDEPLRFGRGDAQQRQRGQAGPAGPHRVDGHHRFGRGAVAGVDREHGTALTIRTDGLEQPGHRSRGVTRAARVRVALRLVRLAMVPVRARGQLDQLRAE